MIGTAPALEAIEYKNIVFDGVLDAPSEYRGPPGAAIDYAWDKISLNNSHKSKHISWFRSQDMLTCRCCYSITSPYLRGRREKSRSKRSAEHCALPRRGRGRLSRWHRDRTPAPLPSRSLNMYTMD